jgi:hypothetical protein
MAAAYLRTGLNAPGTIAPRHCLSAARAAATAVAEAAAPGTAIDDALADINSRLVQLVRDNAAPGLRGGDGADQHKRFIEGFAAFM